VSFVNIYSDWSREQFCTGRSKFASAKGIRELMGEKGLVEEDWNDRHNWRKKII
jgi:hypothetical protein